MAFATSANTATSAARPSQPAKSAIATRSAAARATKSFSARVVVGARSLAKRASIADATSRTRAGSATSTSTCVTSPPCAPPAADWRNGSWTRHALRSCGPSASTMPATVTVMPADWKRSPTLSPRRAASAWPTSAASLRARNAAIEPSTRRTRSAIARDASSVRTPRKTTTSRLARQLETTICVGIALRTPGIDAISSA